MKKLFLSLLVGCVGLTRAATPLGVLYDPAADNLTSPNGLRAGIFYVLTNLSAPYITTNSVVLTDTTGKLVPSALTTNQAFALSQIVGTNNLIFLGTPSLSSGSTSPTNGVAGVINGSIYIHTGGSATALIYFSHNTNWYNLASTNGGTIVESQFGFTDVTTANTSTTNHGLAMKLSGTTNTWYSGIGTWSNPLTTQLSGLTDGRILRYDATLPGGPGVNQTTLSYNSLANSVTLEGAGFGLNGIFRTDAIVVTNATTLGAITGNSLAISNVAASSLLRLNSANQLAAVTIGPGISFDGTTLSSSGGSGAVGITGTPAANQVAYWTSSGAIGGDSDFTFDGTTVTAGTLTAANLSVTSNGGNILSGTYTPTRTAGTGSTTVGTTAYTSMYTRVGNIVTVQGRVQMAKTSSSGTIDFTISLPIASDLASVNDLYGQGNNIYYTAGLPTVEIGSVAVIADLVNNTAKFYLLGSSATGTLRDCHFTFTYQVH